MPIKKIKNLFILIKKKTLFALVSTKIFFVTNDNHKIYSKF